MQVAEQLLQETLALECANAARQQQTPPIQLQHGGEAVTAEQDQQGPEIVIAALPLRARLAAAASTHWAAVAAPARRCFAGVVAASRRSRDELAAVTFVNRSAKTAASKVHVQAAGSLNINTAVVGQRPVLPRRQACPQVIDSTIYLFNRSHTLSLQRSGPHSAPIAQLWPHCALLQGAKERAGSRRLHSEGYAFQDYEFSSDDEADPTAADAAPVLAAPLAAWRGPLEFQAPLAEGAYLSWAAAVWQVQPALQRLSSMAVRPNEQLVPYISS